MVNLGNAWHLPGNPEPFGNAGMRDPVFPTDPVPSVTIFSGNQFQGGGNPGNQLQDGSALFFKQTTDTAWQTVPLIFATAIDNNKYYSGAIPTGAFPTGTIVQYYLCIAYDDHDTTFLQAAPGMLSVTTGDETAAQSSPFTFTIETPAVRGQWGAPFTLLNVGIHAHVLPNGLVLMWGRRDNPQQSLDTDPPSPLGPGLPPAPPATCTPFLWNPANGDLTPTPPPPPADGETNANLSVPATRSCRTGACWWPEATSPTAMAWTSRRPTIRPPARGHPAPRWSTAGGTRRRSPCRPAASWSCRAVSLARGRSPTT